MEGISPEKLSKLILSVGTHRSNRPFTPVEVATAIQSMLDAGEELEDIADVLQLDNTDMLRRFLRLLELHEEIQMLIAWGVGGSTISFTSASEIGKLTATEQSTLAKAILENQLSSSEVKQIIQVKQRSNRNIADAVNAILRLRPQVIERHIILGEISDPELNRSLSTLTQKERDELLENLLRASIEGLQEFEAKLGIKNIVLIGDRNFQRKIISNPVGFERFISDLLRSNFDRD